MKIHHLVAIAGLLVLPSLAFSADYLVETATNQWSVDRNIVLTGSNSTFGTQSSGLGGNLNVAQYSGSGDLTRVIITVLQPAPSVSNLITATLSIGEDESTTFTNNALVNKVTERSQLVASSSFASVLAGVGASVDDYDKLKNGTPGYSNQSLTYPGTLGATVNLTQSPLVVFDSASFGLTTSQLNAIFRGISTLGFQYLATSSFGWDQDTAATITATLSGLNTGQVKIEYYVPEPHTAMLSVAGIGFVLFFGRRRRLGLA